MIRNILKSSDLNRICGLLGLCPTAQANWSLDQSKLFTLARELASAFLAGHRGIKHRLQQLVSMLYEKAQATRGISWLWLQVRNGVCLGEPKDAANAAKLARDQKICAAVLMILAAQLQTGTLKVRIDNRGITNVQAQPVRARQI